MSAESDVLNRREGWGQNDQQSDLSRHWLPKREGTHGVGRTDGIRLLVVLVLTGLFAFLAAVEAAWAHSSEVACHHCLHHLAGTLELLEKLVYFRK